MKSKLKKKKSLVKKKPYKTKKKLNTKTKPKKVKSRKKKKKIYKLTHKNLKKHNRKFEQVGGMPYGQQFGLTNQQIEELVSDETSSEEAKRGAAEPEPAEPPAATDWDDWDGVEVSFTENQLRKAEAERAAPEFKGFGHLLSSESAEASGSGGLDESGSTFGFGDYDDYLGEGTAGAPAEAEGTAEAAAEAAAALPAAPAEAETAAPAEAEKAAPAEAETAAPAEAEAAAPAEPAPSAEDNDSDSAKKSQLKVGDYVVLSQNNEEITTEMVGEIIGIDISGMVEVVFITKGKKKKKKNLLTIS